MNAPEPIRGPSLLTKVVVAVAGCMLVLVVAATVLVGRSSREAQHAAAENALRAAAMSLANVEQSETEKLAATLDAVLANGPMQEAFVARDRERLLALARPLFDRLAAGDQITHLYFLDPAPARTCFLRVHQPDLHGDVIRRATLSRAIETGELAAGKELGKTAFALRVVKPWRDAKGQVVGYVELGEEIDHFLERVKAVTGDEVGLAVPKKLLDGVAWAELAQRSGRRNSWGDRPDTVVVNATVDDADLAAFDGPFDGLPPGGKVLDERRRGTRWIERAIVPVKDAAGNVVAGLFVLHDDTAQHARTDRQRALLVSSIAVAAVVLATLLVLLLRRLVLQRLQRMMAAMEDAAERLAGGDTSVGETVVPTGDDEIGRFEEFFGRFLRVVGELVRSMDRKIG